MSESQFEEQEFVRQDYRGRGLTAGVYELCMFRNCEFAAADMQHSRFISCRFISCNLSLALISNSSFRDVRFEGCKMLGLRFDQCSGFGLDASFTDCILDQSVFHKVAMPKTTLKSCSIAEADFSSADLREIAFENCDLRDSDFSGADLRKADFRTARNYRLDPERAKLKAARFSLPEVLSLLDKHGLRIEH
jgi:fluoroquinolone resistance protein